MSVRVKKIILAGIALLAVPAIILCAAVEYLIAPHPAHVGSAPADLQAQDIQIAVAGQRAVAGWYSPGTTGQGEILLLHGIQANRTSQIERMRLLKAQGYGVLAIDLPAHGESAGDHVTFGHNESRAVISAVGYLRSQRPGARIGVIGQSLGGASLVLAGPDLGADAIILEAVFGDIETATANRLHHYSGALGTLAAPLLVKAASARLGLSPLDLQPARAIAHVEGAKLVIAGETDIRATPDESRHIFESAKGPKDFWLVPGAAHVDYFRFAPQAYREHVLPFLRKYLKAP